MYYFLPLTSQMHINFWNILLKRINFWPFDFFLTSVSNIFAFGSMTGAFKSS